MTRLSCVPFLLLSGACGSSGETAETGGLAASRTDLSKLFPASAELVGVAITPDGTRYVLDKTSGLHAIHGNSTSLVVDAKTLVDVELTDVVAIDSEHLALTAVNDGFLFNLTTTQLSSYFCYLPAEPEQPGPMPESVSQSFRAAGIEVEQRTESVAYNPATRQIFAQPRTTRLDTGETVGSELFVFTEQGGQPIRVVDLVDTRIVAGGMVAAADSRLFLGIEDRIFEAMSEGPVYQRKNLGTGVRITGMARDPEDMLWYLDGPTRQLVQIGETLTQP